MNAKLFDKAFRFIFILVFVLGMVGVSVQDARAEEPSPNFATWDWHSVFGSNWPLENLVTLTVDNDTDPGNGILHTDTDTSHVAPWDPNSTAVQYEVPFNLLPGHFITLSDGIIIKTMTIVDIAITNVDPISDIVSGTAPAGMEVNVDIHNMGARRHTVADGNGHWSVDFAHVGLQDDEQDIIDLIPGSSGNAYAPDDDGDATGINWRVPDPHITAYPAENTVVGEDFPANAVVTLTIDDPTNGSGIDVTLQNPINKTGGRCTGYCVEFSLPEWFHLAGGQLVTLDDGTNTISYTVSNLSSISVDVQNDTVSGIADPYSPVYLTMWFWDGTRHLTADEYGHWSADFSVPGSGTDEQGTCDFSDPDQNCDGMIIQWEGDDPLQDNRTRIDWRVPHPQITVGTEWDAVFGHDWPLGATVNLTIDDPDTSQTVDFSQVVILSPDDTEVQFDLDGFDVQPGHIVTFTDGTFAKVLIVTHLLITTIDTDLDRIMGIAEPFGNLQVDVRQSGGWPQLSPSLSITADQNGEWMADFAGVVDITTDHEVFAHEVDEDGDVTMDIHGFYAPPLPTIAARPGEQQISGYDWPEGATINLMVDDPSTPQSPDYTKTETVTFSDWDPNQTFAQFRVWEDGFTLQPGMFVTMTDGSVTKTHTVTDLVVLGADADTDTVWGTGTPGTWVEVGHLCDNEGCAIRRTMVATDGTWLVDFSVPGGTEPDEQKTYDLQECEGNEARQHDEDGDSTQYGWDTYCPPMIFTEQYTFNFNNTLIADPIIRQAIALGTDRQRILDQAFLTGGEYGQLVNSPIPPGNPYLAPASELTLYYYNPDEARTLLTNAGWVDTNGDGIREKDGQELAFTFKTSINPMRTIAAQVFRENMEAIGIRITVIQESFGMFFADDGTLVRGEFDIAEFAWSADLEGISILDLYRTIDEQNFGSYGNPDYDAALEAFQNAGSEEERIIAAHQAQQILTADLPAFYLFTRENIIPHQTPTGTSVTLTPLPQVTITYTNVNEEGVTAALAVSLNPADLPQNMQLVDSAYEIGTTAMFETVKVCLAYRDHWMSPAQEAILRLYHYHNSVWLDVTDLDSPDTVNNIVCGTATDFSLFAILLPLNQPPQITSVTAPIDPVQLGETITATVTFDDPDVGDTHTALWDWGDGTTTTIPAAPPTVSAFHNYASPGVYTITVTVTDSAGESDTEAFQYVVIYDPEGGFVTGGGWIWSPEGAYTPDPTLTGKATFGFVSKYQKGAKVPTGNTEFQFKVADLNFRSTSYDWLVIAGSKAQYKGSGTINGAGEYDFLLTAIDGSPDRFRIKIWDKSTGEIIYDNMLGAADDANPSTAIGGGAIVIHKEK